jgi:isocitrate lyase
MASELQTCQRWMQGERFRDTLRPYTAAVSDHMGAWKIHLMHGIDADRNPPYTQDVVALRPSLTSRYPAADQSVKLWSLLTHLRVS